MDEIYRLRSSRSNKDYEVTRHEGQWACSCPHYIYRCRKRGVYCKHIDQIIRHRAEQNRLQTHDWEMDWEIPLEELHMRYELLRRFRNED